MRACYVHHYRCAGHPAVTKTNPTHTAILFEDLFNLHVESELGPARFRRAMQVVGRKLRVGDVAAGRKKDGAVQTPAGGLAKVWMFGSFCRGITLELEHWQTLDDLLAVQLFIRAANLFHDVDGVLKLIIAFGFHHQTAAVDVTRVSPFVLGAKKVLPILPVKVRLISHG